MYCSTLSPQCLLLRIFIYFSTHRVKITSLGCSHFFFFTLLYLPPPELGAVPSWDSGGAAVFSDLNPQILSIVCGGSWWLQTGNCVFTPQEMEYPHLKKKKKKAVLYVVVILRYTCIFSGTKEYLQRVYKHIVLWQELNHHKCCGW